MQRRNFLKYVGAAGAALASRRVWAGPRSQPPKSAPRYYIMMHLYGGMDSVLTTAPKLKKQVSPGVDVPYGPNEIWDRGNLQLAPGLRIMGDRIGEFSILNGLIVDTAAHEAGMEQLWRMRTRTVPEMPAFFDLIGGQRSDPPLPCATVGADLDLATRLVSSHFFGTPGHTFPSPHDNIFQAIDKLDGESRKLLARTMRDHARKLRASNPRPATRAAVALENAERTALFFERVATATPFPPKEPKAPMSIERPLWFLENDLASAVWVQRANFDTHNSNLERQSKQFRAHLRWIPYLIDQLHKRKNRWGTLADNTAVIVMSELGRFPKLNGFDGKDHYPEVPVMLWGRQFRTGEMFGDTGREMQSVPIDFKTGKPTRGGHKPRLDDLGATLLHMAGLTPREYGYTGRKMEFLL